MRRTEPLQGPRLIKFEEAYRRNFRGELNQLQTAEILRMSGRSFRPRHRDSAVAFGPLSSELQCRVV